MTVVAAFVTEARLVPREGTEPAAVGAAVTVALCGHWEHEPPCRWPHNGATVPDGSGWRHRTVFVASAGEEGEVRALIEAALRGGDGWTVLDVRERPVAADEERLAASLLAGPRRLS